MAGMVIPVSLTTEQANQIIELIKRRVQIIEGIHKEAEVWIWDIFGNEIEEKNLLQ